MNRERCEEYGHAWRYELEAVSEIVDRATLREVANLSRCCEHCHRAEDRSLSDVDQGQIQHILKDLWEIVE